MNQHLAAFFLVLNICVPSVFANTMTQPVLADRPMTEMIREIGIDQKLDQPLPLNIEFKNEAGQTVKLGDYFGSKPVLLNLVYFRCPMLCSFVLDGIVKALKPLKFTAGQEFQIITVSIDPKDTPEKATEKKAAILKQYHKPGAEKGWHFLTGTQSSIDTLASAVGFRYVFDAQSGQYAHAGGIMVATPQGKLARYFYGIEYAPRDLRFAFIESSQNKIGSFTDQLLLLCFHYDPMTGKYGLLIMNILRLAGFSTAGFAALGVILMLRREHSSRQSKAGAL